MIILRIFNKIFMSCFQLTLAFPNLDLLLSFSIALALAFILTFILIIIDGIYVVNTICKAIQILAIVLYKL